MMDVRSRAPACQMKKMGGGPNRNTTNQEERKTLRGRAEWDGALGGEVAAKL